MTEPVRERGSTEDAPERSPPPPRPPPPPIPEEILRKIHEVEQETFLGQIPMQEPRGSPGRRARPEVLPENMFIRVLHWSLRRVAGAEERAGADGSALVRTVELTRAPGEMLGFYIRQGNGLDRDHGIFVSRIMAGSLVDRYGLLRIGDEILTVNSVDVSYMKLAEVVAIMQIPTRLVMNVTTQKYATLPVKSGEAKRDQLTVENGNPTRKTPNKPRRSASQRISRSPKSSGRQKSKRPERSSSLEDKHRIPFQKDQIQDDFDFEKFLFNPPSLKEKPLPEIPKDCKRPTKTPPIPPPSKDKDKIKEALCSGKRLTRLDLAVARTKLDEAYHQAYDLLLNSLEKEEEEEEQTITSPDAVDENKTVETTDGEEAAMEDGRESPEGEASVTEVPMTWTKLDRSLRSHHLESLQHHSSRSSSDREEWGDEDVQGDSYVEHNPIYESDEDDYNSAPVWSEGESHVSNGFIKKNGPERAVMDGGTDEDDPTNDPQDYSQISSEDRADYESGTWKSDKTWQSDSSCAPADMADSPLLQRRGRVGKIGEVHARAVLSPPRSPSNITVKKKQEWYQRRAKISPELARRISGEEEEEGREEETIGEPEEPDLSRSRSPKREGFWSALSQLSPTTVRKFAWKKPVTNRSQSVEEENRGNTGTDSDDSPKMTQRNHTLLPEIALTPEQKLSSLQNKGKVVAKYHLDSSSNSDNGATTRGGGVGSVFTRTRLYRSFNRDRSNNDRTIEKIPNGDLAGRGIDLGSYKKCKSDDGNKGLCPVSGILAIELYSLKGMKVFKKSSKDLYCVIEVDGAPRARTVVRDGEQEVVWNEKFALELNDAYQICFNFYNWDNIRRHKVNCAGTLNLSHLTRQASEKIALKMDPRGTMYVTLTLDPNMEDGDHSLTSTPGLGRLFGVDLDRVVEEEGCSCRIPLIVKKSVSEVEERGMSVIGIYRLCGSAYRKKDLRDEFEIDSVRTDITADKYPDINVITGVLKDFLRELPEPLFSPALSDVVCAKPVDKTPEEMLQCLGPVQKVTLSYLLDHLKRVAANSAVNKMDYNNLAVCFGPVLCSPPQGPDVDGAQGALLAAIDFRKHIAALQTLLEMWPANRDPDADKDGDDANDDSRDKDEPNNNDLPESDSTLLYSRLRGNTSSSEDSRPEADRTDSDTSQRSHEPSPRLGRDGSPRTGRLQVYDEVFEETANLTTRYQSYEEMEELAAEGGKQEQSTLERRMVERGKMVQRDRSFRGDRPARIRVTVEEDYVDMEGRGTEEEEKSPKRREGVKNEGKERDENIANESKDSTVGDKDVVEVVKELKAMHGSARISRKHEKEYVNLAPYRAALGVSCVDDENDTKVTADSKTRQEKTTPKSPVKAYIDYSQLSKSRERLSDSSSSREQLTDSSERLTESPKPYKNREPPSPRDKRSQASVSEKAYIDLSQLRGHRKQYLHRSRTEEIHARYTGNESASEERPPTIQVPSTESLVRRRLRSFEGDSRGDEQGPDAAAPFARAGVQGEGAEQRSCRQRGRVRAATDSALFIHEGDSDFEEGDRLLSRDFARRLPLQSPVPESLSVDEGIDVRALSPQDLSVDMDLSAKFHDIDRLVSETIKDTLLASTSPYKGGAKSSRSKDSLDSGAVLSPSMSRDGMAMGGSQPSPESCSSRDEGWSDIDQWILERWNSIDHLMETWTLSDNPKADVSEC